ncbi:MAG TPA: ribosome-associated translation inhibitor RaiA [Desulfobacteraceae bacterium]|nr:ribosome-associated translation inhibitor RaiA [Desulfobacteraceae bacterium]
MHTSVTFKNIDPSDHLKSYISEKLNRFDRFLDSAAEAGVVLSVEKHRHIAEVRISGGKISINGEEETNDMYSAIDMVLDKLEKQIKKNKQKIRDHRSPGKASVKDMGSETAEEREERARQIKIKNIEYKPMDIEEAMMQMDLIRDNFLVFANSKTDRVNVIYRRKDGNYGLIQPND